MGFQSKLLVAALLLNAATGPAAVLVTNVAQGGAVNHSLFLKSDGSLWAMGINNNGELGDGTYNTTNRPEPIVASGVTAVAAGGNAGTDFSLFIKSDGSLWGMGANGAGQLGDFAFSRTNRPKQIVASGVTAVAAGGSHSLFLKSDGSLWAMGGNSHGQLGDGSFNTAYLPERIVPSGVTAIAAGVGHSIFLMADGSLWGMGWDYACQLGDGTYTDTNQPEQIVASGVTAIAAGYNFTVFLQSDGSLWGMGNDGDGQLGPSGGIFPTELLTGGVAAITTGSFHSLFLKSDGSLWVMGRNRDGQLGDGTFNGTSHAEQIVANGVRAMCGGDEHSLFVKSDGSLWAMGYNFYGQLGDGTYSNTNRPEQVVAAPPGFNQLAIQSLAGGNVRLSYLGVAGANYALDRSLSLAPPINWVPVATNPAPGGTVVFTDTPGSSNSFWRIRSVP